MSRSFAALVAALLIATLGCFGKLAGLPLVHRLELVSADLFQHAAPRPAQDEPALIVDIDQRSLGERGQWPWAPALLAQLTNRLQAAGAAVIGFDLVLAEPDREAIFAEAVRRAPVVLGSRPNSLGAVERPAEKAGFIFAGEDPLRLTSVYPGAVVSAPELEAAATGSGSLDEDTDADGVVRRLPLVERVSGVPYPGFVAEVLRVGLGARSYIGHASETGDLALGAGHGLAALKIGPLVVPTDAQGRMRIAYSPIDRDRWLSATDVLAGRFDASEMKDRIVLVGSSAVSFGDRHETPAGAGIPGVEIHAQAIDQAVAGWFLTRPRWASTAELLFIALITPALALLRRSSVLRSGILAGYALAFAWGLSWWAFRSAHLLIDPLYPSLVILLVFASSAILGATRPERQPQGELYRA
ncbi:MAG TPA: CHASE2 domain-containing protein [Stellaceae bacterium]|nr:CHASE2 domain-containing protein [Stellaceae bacterium]